jgi:Na+/melibiose symporter-like transporter
MFSTFSVYMLLTIHATIYYEYLGAPLALLAFFTAFSRSFDVITDPVCAWVSDNTRSRWGRRKPYILGGMWFYALALILVLGAGRVLPSDVAQSAGGECYVDNVTGVVTGDDAVDPEKSKLVAYYYGVTYVLFYIFDTICQVPYNALGPEIAPDMASRSKLFFTSNIFGFVGTLVGASAPVLIGFFVPKSDAFFLTGCVFGIYYIVTQINMSCRVKESPHTDLNDSIPLVPTVNRAFKNPCFRVLVIARLIDAIGWFALAALLPFFLKYIVRPGVTPPWDFMDDEAWLGIAFFGFFTSVILGAPMWKCVEKKLGLYKTWLAFNLMNGVTNSLFIFVGRGDVVFGMIVTVLNGIPMGGRYLSDAHLAACISVDEFYTGEKREAAYTMFASFVPKVVSIPSNALPLAAISAAGFISSQQICNEETGSFEIVPMEQNDRVKSLIKFFYIGMPVICNAISFYVKLQFPLKTAEEHQAIADGIALHKQGKAARDPISGEMVPSNVGKDALFHLKGVHLDYFNAGEQHTLYSRDGNGSFLITKSATQFVVCLVILICSVLTVLGTFDWLEKSSLSFVPSCAQISVGVFLMLVFFYASKFGAASRLKKAPIEPEFVLEWSEMSHTSKKQSEKLQKLKAQAGKGTSVTARVNPGDDGDSSRSAQV